MLLASKHYTPVMGIDFHATTLPPFNMFHPYIGLVMDIGEYIPYIGCNTFINGVRRAGTYTFGMLATKVHFPIASGAFAKTGMIGNQSINFYGSDNTYSEGCRLSAAPHPLMTCNDTGMVLSCAPGKTFSPETMTYAPTAVSLPLPSAAPVMVGGPYVPDWAAMLRNLVMGYGFGCIFKGAGKLIGKGLTRFNHSVLKKSTSKWSQNLSDYLCRKGFEPVNLITGAVEYEGTDFELPGPIPLIWKRRWLSDSLWQGPLGHGCHFAYDMRIERFEEHEALAVTLSDGRPVAFHDIKTGESDFSKAEKLLLTHKGDHYELFDYESRLTYHFPLKENSYEADKNEYPLTRIQNEAGHSIHLRYLNGMLDEITDSAGRLLTVFTDREGRITRVVLKESLTKIHTLVSYEYNENGDMIAITDTLGKSTRIVYENHLMVKKTDRTGQTFYWEYDGSGSKSRCTHTWGDGGLLEGWIEYKEGYNLVTDSLGAVTRYDFTDEGYVRVETDPVGAIRQTDYTEEGQLKREVDAEGNITGYDYNELGLLSSIHYPDGTSEIYNYDKEGRLSGEINPAGAVTLYIYGENGLLDKKISPGNLVTEYRYNKENLLSEIKNQGDRKISFLYDPSFNLTEALLPDGMKIKWEYDYKGQLISSKSPEGHETRFLYDALGRLIQSTSPDGNTVHLKYNAYEEVLLAWDKERKVEFTYTPLGSLKTRKENGKALHFHYNTEDQLTSLTNEEGECYTFERDKAGRIIRETSFDGLTKSYKRSPNGWVRHIQKTEKSAADYIYDPMGRLCGVEYSDGTFEQYAYDKNGLLIKAENRNSLLTITRDKEGRILEECQDGHTVKSHYNKEGERCRITSSLGADLAAHYTTAGLLEKMSAGDWHMSLQYNKEGQEIERILPGEVISRKEYDRAGRIHRHSISRGQRRERSMRYEWATSERLISILNEITGQQTSFTYDLQGNLRSAAYPDTESLFRIPDAVGNLYRTRSRSDRRYGPSGRLLETENSVYHYDEEGNIGAKVVDRKDVWLYNWNENGSLKEVIRPDQKKVSFEYDALGRRTAKIFDGKIIRFLWDGNTPLHEWQYAETDRPKELKDEWGFSYKDKEEPVENITTWVFEEGTFRPAAKLTESGSYSIITDYLGTPAEMYTEEGEKCWQIQLDIYGKIRTFEGGSRVDCPFRYPGQYEDEETGLYYNRFRYYAPEEGLYLSQDPIGLAGGNPTLYGYVYNPHKEVDYLGLTLEARSIDIVNKTANETNATFPKGYEPPYRPGTKVTEFTTVKDEVFVRVHGSSNKVGGWIMKESAIKGLTPDQIRAKYSLPETPSHISKVLVPAGTRMRSGTVNPIFGGSKARAKQFQLLNHIPVDNYNNTKLIKCH